MNLLMVEMLLQVMLAAKKVRWLHVPDLDQVQKTLARKPVMIPYHRAQLLNR